MSEQNHDQRIAELESTIEAQQARIETLEQENAALKQDVTKLQSNKASIEEQLAAVQPDKASLEEQLADVQAENEQLHDRIAQLEAQPEVTIADESDPIGSLHIAGAPVGQAITSKPGQSDLVAELDALREELADYASDAFTDTQPTVDPETPLEQIVALPQSVVDDQLTANQRRARFVATDITEYATKTPAGWVLRPKDLRTVLNAAFDTGHSQTCSRVRTILADLGDDYVEIKASRGEKKLVVDETLVGRLVELQSTDHDVVSPWEV